MKYFAYIVLIIVSIFALIWISNDFQIFSINKWGVKKANAQREVFEQSQSFIEGKNQELTKLHHEWVDSDADSKETIEAVIRHTFSDFDPENIKDQDIREFLRKIKNN